MDYQNEQIPGYDSFAQAAFVMAILSLIGCRMLFIPTIVASIAIILAMLSKGFRRHLTKKARYAFLIAVAAIILNLILSVQTMVRITDQMKTPEFREQFNQMYEDIYGVPYDDSINLWGGEAL